MDLKTLHQKTNVIDTLQQRLSRAECQRDEALDQLDVARSTLDEAQRDILALSTKLKESEIESEEWASKAKTSQADIKAIRTQNGELIDHAFDLSCDVTTLHTESMEHMNRAKGLEKDLRETKRESEETKRELEETKRELEETQRDLEGTKKDLMNESKRREELEEHEEIWLYDERPAVVALRAQSTCAEQGDAPSVNRSTTTHEEQEIRPRQLKAEVTAMPMRENIEIESLHTQLNEAKRSNQTHAETIRRMDEECKLNEEAVMHLSIEKIASDARILALERQIVESRVELEESGRIHRERLDHLLLTFDLSRKPSLDSSCVCAQDSALKDKLDVDSVKHVRRKPPPFDYFSTGYPGQTSRPAIGPSAPSVCTSLLGGQLEQGRGLPAPDKSSGSSSSGIIVEEEEDHDDTYSLFGTNVDSDSDSDSSSDEEDQPTTPVANKVAETTTATAHSLDTDVFVELMDETPRRPPDKSSPTSDKQLIQTLQRQARADKLAMIELSSNSTTSTNAYLAARATIRRLELELKDDNRKRKRQRVDVESPDKDIPFEILERYYYTRRREMSSTRTTGTCIETQAGKM